ncbi:hypothetical protein [Sorangium sp. So ce204]|uniref:hypothetical protein n=1 Tax=Sorangium sp. So ce204 TaxID=3133288 RepID=UPI003F5DA2EC
MDRAIAEKILSAANECSRKIDESVGLLRKMGHNNEELATYGKYAGKVMSGIFQNITAPIYEEHPDLAPDWYRQMNEKRPTRRTKE